jgi:NTE family protein
METIFTSLIHSNIQPPELAAIEETDISEMADLIPKNKIRHLVLSGGGAWGLYMYGILSEAMKTGFVEKSNIRTIHCTSVGSILAVMFSLNYEEDVIQDYLIKRPWKTVFRRGSANMFQIYETYGFFTVKIFEDLFEPLFKALELTLGLTLQELYDYTGVEIHIFATELNRYKLVDMSYRTHPHWRVCDAVYASCSIPILFSPILDDTSCYLDGGLLANYPLRHLVSATEVSEMDVVKLDEIFGISVIEQGECMTITKNILVSIEQFLFCIFYKIIEYFSSFQSKPDILYEIKVVKTESMIGFTYNTIISAEYRENVIHQGKQIFRNYAKKWWSETDAAEVDAETESESESLDCPTDNIL